MGERRFSTKNRFVSFLLAIAMVLTLLPIGAVQAKAEEATVKLYFELPNGTSVNDWCVNAWGNSVTISGMKNTNFVLLRGERLMKNILNFLRYFKQMTKNGVM